MDTTAVAAAAIISIHLLNLEMDGNMIEAYEVRMGTDTYLRYGMWSQYGHTSVCGKVLNGDHELTPQELDELLSGGGDAQILSERVKDLNGFYAIVHGDECQLFALVDRVRSIPLFYGHDDRSTYVSDDPFWIQAQLNDRSIDDYAKKELLLTGYVTDDRTLSPVIKQVRSGEVVHLSTVDGPTTVSRSRYQFYLPVPLRENNLDDRMRDLDEAMVKAFQRLVDIANGRTIVVPLSGGYDSRLVAIMLKRVGYSNVITFSYGRQGSQEVEIGRALASALGMQWEFVEYTNEKWFGWYHSDEFKHYSHMANGLSSTPHVQDFPAVKILKEKGLIPPDSIFVPGHTVGLGLVPQLEGDLSRIEDAVDDILLRHYNISGSPISDPKTLGKMREYIAGALGDLTQYHDRICACLSWDFNNRQSKLIVNSMRVYEYWGYTWWLPLDDKDLMDCWCEMPAEMRNDKKLFKHYTREQANAIFQGTEVPIYGEGAAPSGVKSVVGAMMKNRTASKLVSIPYYKKRKQKLYHEHPQAYYGMIPWDVYDKEFTGRESINYYHAKNFIARLIADDQ